MAQAQKEFSIVGKRTPRIDAYERVTGQAQYTGDIQLPGMLYARVLRSPHPHAKIVGIDTSKAEKLPGVKTVILQPLETYDDSANTYESLMRQNLESLKTALGG